VDRGKGEAARRRSFRTLEHLQHLLMDQAIAGKDTIIPDIVGFTGKTGHRTAGFLYQELSGRYVPRVQLSFPEAIQSPCSHIGKIERGSAKAPHGPCRPLKIKEILEIIVAAVRPVIRKTGGKKTLSQGDSSGNRQPVTVQKGPAALHRGKQLSHHRVKDDAKLHRSRHFQGDGNAKPGYAVGVIRGAVKRVDHPGISRPGGGILVFFGKDIVMRMILPDHPDDESLAGLIDFGDEVRFALVADGDITPVPLLLEIAGRLSRNDCCIQKLVHIPPGMLGLFIHFTARIFCGSNAEHGGS